MRAPQRRASVEITVRKLLVLGALLMVGGIAGQVVAAAHAPGWVTIYSTSSPNFATGSNTVDSVHIGWHSVTTYEAVRIGGWALIVFGAVIVVFALARELRRAPDPTER